MCILIFLYNDNNCALSRLLAAKSSSFTSIEKITQTIINIIREIATHQSFCASFGLSLDELEKTPEASATTAYGAYLIDVGLTGS